jgi:citrate lyase subunit beta/citryl-CoA lyase
MIPAPRRAPHLRRSWLFLPGADRSALLDAARSGADVLIQELEDFTPAERRGEARGLAAEVYAAWRAAGVLAAVRVNPLETVGGDDLRAAMAGRPDIVMMSKVARPEQVVALEAAVSALEAEFGIAVGSTELVPNVESAAGLVRTAAIAGASARVTGALVASEDMVADLGAERTREGLELSYVRSRFLVECVAAGVLAIDCPYIFGDEAGAEAEARTARRLGYKAKSLVSPGHAPSINRVLTPSAEEVVRARRIVAAFEAARAAGRDRAEVDGLLAEVPTYAAALRLLARAAELDQASRS